jgi:hypothetical protein
MVSQLGTSGRSAARRRKSEVGGRKLKYSDVRASTSDLRAGLSTLELVLCLPILLFVTALMFSAESKMCWKVRGTVAARDAAWRGRYPRTGARLPNPGNWQPPATMSAVNVAPVPQLDLPALRHPVARGPQLQNFQVDNPRLDPSRGGLLGRSQRPWTAPLLPKIGAADLNARHSLVDGKWQYSQM